MRRLIALFLAAHVAAFSPFCDAAPTTQQVAAILRKKATGGQVFFVKQNFEGAGYDNGESWTESGTGTVDEDYATAPAPLKGAQSLRCANGSGAAYAYTLFAVSKDNYWLHARIHPGTGQGNNFPSIAADCTIGSYGVGLYSGGPGLIAIKVHNAGVGATSTYTPATNTTLYVWFHYVRNGTCEIFVSDTTTRPTVDDASGTYLTFTPVNNEASVAVIVGCNTGTYHFDNVLCSDTEIGNNPLP